MDTTTPLTADQQLLLATATRHPDRTVVPRPAGLRARGAVRQRLLAALLERGLVEERSTEDEALAWRRDERGRHRALRLTAAGIAEAGAPAHQGNTKAGTVSEGRPATSRHPPGGKLGKVLEAVEAPGGATLAELVGLTGWQPHTTRAALTRLRQRGHSLHLDTSGGRKAYRFGPAGQG